MVAVRWKDRVEPQRGHAELSEHLELGLQPAEVADPIPVAVAEGADEHLVADLIPPIR